MPRGPRRPSAQDGTGQRGGGQPRERGENPGPRGRSVGTRGEKWREEAARRESRLNELNAAPGRRWLRAGPQHEAARRSFRNRPPTPTPQRPPRKSPRTEPNSTRDGKVLRKMAELMLTRSTKRSPSGQDVDAAPKSDPLTVRNRVPGAPGATLVSTRGGVGQGKHSPVGS